MPLVLGRRSPSLSLFLGNQINSSRNIFSVNLNFVSSLAAAGFNAYNLYAAHLEHQKHHPKEWILYPYINFRARSFFWGKESLFFNPEVNLSVEQE